MGGAVNAKQLDSRAEQKTNYPPQGKAPAIMHAFQLVGRKRVDVISYHWMGAKSTIFQKLSPSEPLRILSD